MGFGLSFAKPGGHLWGSVVARSNNGNLEVLVSTIHRRLAILAVILVFGVMVPFFILIAWLSSIQILPDANREPAPFLLLAFGYAALITLLGYEFAMGIFPSDRRLQKIMMLACDRAAVKLGGEPIGSFKMITKFVKARKVSLWEWRIWKRDAWRWLWQPWPDMISEEEFLKQTA